MLGKRSGTISRLIALTSVVLTGCGEGIQRVERHRDGSLTHSLFEEKNGGLKMQLGGTSTEPVKLPPWAPAYPGSNVLIAQTQAQAFAHGAFQNVILETPDSVSKVRAFYDKRMTLAGMRLIHKITDGDLSARTVATPSGPVTVGVAENDDGGSTISITRMLDR